MLIKILQMMKVNKVADAIQSGYKLIIQNALENAKRNYTDEIEFL